MNREEMYSTLCGEHIVLRKAKETDYRSMLENVWGDEAVYRWMLFPPTRTEEEAIDRCRRSIAFQKEHFAWFVALKETDEAIGMFTLFAATKFGILPLYYIGCSFMGAGTGIGYVCPIKQLLSNFSDHKGLASGLAITGFGAGKFVAAPAIEYLLANFELPYLFLILGCAFLTVMSVCSWLFRPNPAFIMTKKTAIPFKDLVHTKFLTMEYVSIWVMFCINISCGLALIAQEKSLLKYLGFKEIALIMALTAVFNVLGRFGMSTLSDYIGRKGAYHYVCSLSILAAFLCYTEQAWLAICGIMMVEFAYGGNFSVLPSLLAKRFGTSCVSTVHAMTLSGWGIAGIIGPTLGNIFTGNNLFLVLGGLYLFGFTMMEIFVKKDSHQEIKGV